MSRGFRGLSRIASYVVRLETLGLHRLTERRIVCDYLLARKIMNRECILTSSNFFTYRPARDRTHTFGIHIEFTKCAARFNSFAVRASRMMSDFPPYLTILPTKAVKKALYAYLHAEHTQSE